MPQSSIHLLLDCFVMPEQKRTEDMTEKNQNRGIKTFEEFMETEPQDLIESRLLRKGGVLLLARSAKKHGDDVTRSLEDAKRKIKGSPLDSDNERLKSLQEGLQDLCDGLISIRKQNGAITGIVTTAVLLNERTEKQVQKLLRK